MLSGLSIKWKLLIPVIFILLMTVVQIFLITNMIKAQQADAARVNLAGRQRAISQKMTKETLNYIIQQDGLIAEKQAAEMETLEKSLKTLINGGTIELSGRTVLIEPTQNEAILSALNEAEQYWEMNKHIFTEALIQPTPAAVTEINNASSGLLERFDKIAGMYETASNEMVRRNMIFIYTGLSFFLLIAAAAWYYVQRNFVRPLLFLRDTANKIAAGDLSQLAD
ncbi:type IV pili methyl-accepting chemotaxis transducer N-terminal domain-containing protein [Desulfallas thermosapovorans]|uniref:PilJ/NarX-like methyl-accepting chemotaxis transducer n=1 Tax=Desulfallas thermosapovorans DSM 6562 TaxID=1121431 RepID=A0A5S4ZSW4_9FIRM|nr:type IV pili methyl-accepting chemotaxis transducer N-terminal domain-containing protein [Desulfallas thermosapovorans]TYO96029.1 PilJ/NarX-like methyl-accepting chemotaxis transducer [Desulfallas thermosapovorans DSM 6562]